MTVGDGLAGFSPALFDVVPETKGCCSFHPVAPILDALPTPIPPLGERMIARVGDAEDNELTRPTARAFDRDRPTWPTAADTQRRDLNRPSLSPTTFSDGPATQCVHVTGSKSSVSSSSVRRPSIWTRDASPTHSTL